MVGWSGVTRRVLSIVAALLAGVGLVVPAAQAAGLHQVVPAVAPSVAPALTAAPSAAGAFVSLAPTRVLDTRSNLGGTGPVAAGGVVHLHVLGRGGVPASGVSAVVLNVTVVYPKGSGFVTVWPDGTTRPTASNLNFVANQTVPNLVVVKVGADGAVALQNSSGGTVQLLADVSGYYLAGSPSVPGAFSSLAPTRVLDTRSNLGGTGPVPAGGGVHLSVLGRGGVPASGVSAVVLNVTVVYPKSSGYVTVWPDGTTRPTASNLNFVANQTVPNLVVAKVGADGAVALQNSSGGTVQLLADVSGYYLAGTPSVPGAFSSLAPSRLLDTRSNLGGTGPVPAGGVVRLNVLGRGGVPASGVSAVVLNVTVVYPKGSGFVTVWPDGTTRPTASNLNFVANQTVPNLVVAKVGADGAVALQNSSGGTAQLLADVSGYYLAGPVSPVTAAKATTTSTTSMALSWTNPTSGAFTGVVIRRAAGTTPPATPTDGTPVATTSGTATTLTDTALTAGDTYSYALFATDGAHEAAPATLTVTAGSLTWGAPQTIDPNFGHVTSVSCPSASFCAAVDESGDVLTFNGTSWTAPRKMLPDATTSLSSVSCPAASYCVAVDNGGNALTFNGTGWSSPTSIDPGPLTSVSCPSTAFCAAVDGAGDAVTFNGSSWSSVTKVDGTNRLTSVSCPTASFCSAVDNKGNALSFNGAAWSAPAGIDGASWLQSVSCASTSFCSTVDNSGRALMFDGSAWGQPTTIDGTALLHSVSCAPTSFCVAVDAAGHAVTLSGSGWSAPNLVDPNGLVAISCASASFCVGFDDVGGYVRFNGTGWDGLAPVDPYSGRLAGVSCPSSTFCAAVDDSGNAQSYNGSTWLPPQSIGSRLQSVSCASATFCVAVDNSGRAQTFDGSGWASPATIDHPGDLLSVSCPSASFCAATASTGSSVTFNGVTWSAPTTIDGSNPVMSVSCPSATFCAAVDAKGNAVTFGGSGWGTPLDIDGSTNLMTVSCASASFCVAGDMAGNVVMFNGQSWAAPQPIATGPVASVSCPITTSCTALDQYGNAYAFNGSTWSAPHLIESMNGLNAISCPTATFCAVVEPTRSSAVVGAMS